MGFDVASAALWAFPLLLAVVCHEWGHAYAAYRLGDDTAERLGRLTLNPIPHIDPIGTLLMPGLLIASGSPWLFGYAKPVPVSWQNLRNPARDMVWVAAAGPAMNLLLAVLCAGFLALVQQTGMLDPLSRASAERGIAVTGPLVQMAYRGVLINLVLAVFNLIPIPPLDGGRVAVGLLPDALAYPLARLEPFGFLIVFGLIITGLHAVFLVPAVLFLANLLGMQL